MGREPCSGQIAIVVYPRGRAQSGHHVILAPLDMQRRHGETPRWRHANRDLVWRAPHDARLVGDSHARACADVTELLGYSLQRTRVHSARNAHDLVPRIARSIVALAIWPVFEQPDERAVRS